MMLTHASVAGGGVHGGAAFALHLPLGRVSREAVLGAELPRTELRETHRHAAPDGLKKKSEFHIHCWASRHSQGFEEKNLGSSPGLLGQ